MRADSEGMSRGEPLGVTLLNGTAIFAVWAPGATEVRLRGSFTQGSELIMQATQNGVWRLEVDGVREGDGYEYVMVMPGGETCVCQDPRGRWWKGPGSLVVAAQAPPREHRSLLPDWNQLAICRAEMQLLPNGDDFTARYTFDDLSQSLPVLHKLGINAIEISIGYGEGLSPRELAGPTPFVLPQSLGGPDGFKALVREAHSLGMAVLTDIVYCHFEPREGFLWHVDADKACAVPAPYFYQDDRRRTPWGLTRPDFSRAEVRRYLFDNVLMWLDEFQCDGLVLIGVDWIGSIKGDRFGDLEEGVSLLQWINSTVATRFPGKLMVAHSLSNADRLTDAIERSGMGFGVQTDTVFHQQLQSVLLAGNDHERNLDRIIDALYRCFNQDAFKRLISWESASGDESDSSGQEHSALPGLASLGAALVLTSAGIPRLSLSQCLKVDPGENLIAEEPDPSTYCTDPHTVLQRLVRMRLNLDGKTLGLTGSHTRIIHKNDDGKVIAYVRWYDEERRDGVLVLINFSGTAWRDYTIGLPVDSNWHLRLYAGGDAGAHASLQLSDEDHFPEPASLTLNLEPYSVLVLSRVS